MKLLIGADPEFFLKKDGKHVSAYGLISGTKACPVPVPNGAIQVDGMALEFNIDPVSSAKGFADNIDSVLNRFRDIIPTDYEFDFSPVANFDHDYMRDQPEDAKKLGCEPDFNAYTGEINDAPDAEVDFRTASGHIHLGWTEDQDPLDPDHFEACCMMVKQLDCMLGLSSLSWDHDTTRRNLYGKAGAFRPKSYGVEYRVMSNKWLFDRNVQHFIFKAAQVCFDLLCDKKYVYEGYGKTVRDVINKPNANWKDALSVAFSLVPMDHAWQDYLIGLNLKEEKALNPLTPLNSVLNYGFDDIDLHAPINKPIMNQWHNQVAFNGLGLGDILVKHNQANKKKKPIHINLNDHF